MREFLRIIICSCCIGVLASCSSVPETTESSMTQVVKPVSCIAVLPTLSGETEQISQIGGSVQNVQRGARYMDSILRQQLAGQPKVRMVPGEIAGSLGMDIAGASETTGCDGVMVVSVYKFRQRAGSSLAAAEPASTAFDIRIYDAQSKYVLWAADFSETQEPLLSNIFSFSKAHSRGFKWITVEELMEQGLQERLSACPYLKHD